MIVCGQAGFHVHLVSRTAATLEAFAKSLNAEGFSADCTALDAHDVGAMTTCINAVGAARGGIDVTPLTARKQSPPPTAAQLALDPYLASEEARNHITIGISAAHLEELGKNQNRLVVFLPCGPL